MAGPTVSRGNLGGNEVVWSLHETGRRCVTCERFLCHVGLELTICLVLYLYWHGVFRE